MSANIYISILSAFFVSYLIRVLPLTLIRKPITNRFLKSFLFYVPYVTLSVMTFPAIVQATQSPIAGIAALVIGIVISYLGAGLFPVACICCAVVFIFELFLVWFMFNYLFFDLDGTLTDPAEGITNSFIHAYKYFGMEVPDYKTLCSYIGPPLLDTFRSSFGFSEEKAKEGVKVYREYFSTKGLFENLVYEGIPSLLENLLKNGKTLVVATSKPEVYSIQILKHFDLAKYFTFICGSNEDESRSKKDEVIKYALEKCQISDNSKVLMIGDRMHDIIGAKKNGIKSCGVLYGYGSKDELENEGADFIVKDVNDLQKICFSWFKKTSSFIKKDDVFSYNLKKLT